MQRARRALSPGGALFDVTFAFQPRMAELRRDMVSADVDTMHADLAAIAELTDLTDDPDQSLGTIDLGALEQLSHRDWSPLGAVETVDRKGTRLNTGP